MNSAFLREVLSNPFKVESNPTGSPWKKRYLLEKKINVKTKQLSITAVSKQVTVGIGDVSDTHCDMTQGDHKQSHGLGLVQGPSGKFSELVKMAHSSLDQKGNMTVNYPQNGEDDVLFCFVFSDVGQRAEHKELQAMEEAPPPPVHTVGLKSPLGAEGTWSTPGHRNSTAPLYLLLGRDDQLLRPLLHVPKIHTLKELIMFLCHSPNAPKLY